MIKLQCFLCIEWIWADHPKNLSHTFLFIFSFLKVASAAFMCLNINWTNNVPNQTFCSFFHIPLFPSFLLSSLCNGAFECSHIDQEKDIPNQKFRFQRFYNRIYQPVINWAAKNVFYIQSLQLSSSFSLSLNFSLFKHQQVQSAAAQTQRIQYLRALWPSLHHLTTGLSMLYSNDDTHTHSPTSYLHISAVCYLFSIVFLVFCCCKSSADQLARL